MTAPDDDDLKRLAATDHGAFIAELDRQIGEWQALISSRTPEGDAELARFVSAALADEEAQPADDEERWVIAVLREHGRETREVRPDDAGAIMARFRAACERMNTDPATRARIDAIIAETEPAARRCPDDAVCHHGCSRGCFRVACCGPLSGVYANDDWPHRIWKQYQDTDGEL